MTFLQLSLKQRADPDIADLCPCLAVSMATRVTAASLTEWESWFFDHHGFLILCAHTRRRPSSARPIELSWGIPLVSCRF